MGKRAASIGDTGLDGGAMTLGEILVLSFLEVSRLQHPVCTPADPRGTRWILEVAKPDCPKGTVSIDEHTLNDEHGQDCVRRKKL